MRNPQNILVKKQNGRDHLPDLEVDGEENIKTDVKGIG
jgi:hypothetical protein